MKTLTTTVLAAALIPSLAIAKPPPGTNPNSPEAKWWECQKNLLTNQGCCGTANGHILREDQWKETKDKKFPFVVKWNGDTIKVPAAAVTPIQCGVEPDINNRWKAKIWFSSINNINPDGSRSMTYNVICFEYSEGL